MSYKTITMDVLWFQFTADCSAWHQHITAGKNSILCVQDPILLQRPDAVAILSANGSAAFKESYAPIGLNSCDSVMSQ